MTHTTLAPAQPLSDTRTGGPSPETDTMLALYNRVVDAKAGFDVMVEKAEDDFIEVATSFRDMHARHADEIGKMLSPDDAKDGTLMGTVNKAVLTLRAFFDEIDEDVMGQVRRGEQSVLQAFREAEEHAVGPQEAKLIGLRAELEDLLERTRHLD